jgi:protein-disulfide isomerase
MTRPRLLLLAASLLVAPLLGGAAPEATPMPGTFTPAQRAEIVDIVRQALKSDPSILRDAIGAMQVDDGMRQAEAARAAIAGSRQELLAAPGDPVAGNPNGDVTLVEFYDTRCPYCRQLLPTLATLLAQDHGVRLVYKDLPILGPSSQMEARALLAADRQGGYGKLQSVFMHDQGNATADTVRAAAQSVGLDADRLLRDMQDPAIQQRIDANVALARKLGVEGTPAVVIGPNMIPGAVDIADLEHAVTVARQGG